MRRLIANTVFSGLVIAWRLAGCPISTSPPLVKATTEGVVRDPSAFSITLALPPSMTATQEFVVPRSIPMTLAIQHLRRTRPHLVEDGAAGGRFKRVQRLTSSLFNAAIPPQFPSLCSPPRTPRVPRKRRSLAGRPATP